MKKKKKGYGYKQGKFTPQNMSKYKGSIPTYRSSWELKAFQKLDRDPKILKWSSEATVVKYIDPSRNNTVHRYFIDLSYTVMEDGRYQTYWVEIKPSAQCRPPKRGKKQQKTFLKESEAWLRNSAKWKHAAAAAKRRGIKFAIWTEKGFTVLT